MRHFLSGFNLHGVNSSDMRSKTTVAKRELPLVELIALLAIVSPVVFAATEIRSEGGSMLRCIFGGVLGLGLGVAVLYLSARPITAMGGIFDLVFDRQSPRAGFFALLTIVAMICCSLYVGAMGGRFLGWVLVRVSR
jgi:hypothetical protein